MLQGSGEAGTFRKKITGLDPTNHEKHGFLTHSPSTKVTFGRWKSDARDSWPKAMESRTLYFISYLSVLPLKLLVPAVCAFWHFPMSLPYTLNQLCRVKWGCWGKENSGIKGSDQVQHVKHTWSSAIALSRARCSLLGTEPRTTELV